MSQNGERKGLLADWDSTDEEVAEAMGHAIADALREHQRAGVPAAFWDWEKNRVVLVPPEEFVIPDEDAGAPEADDRAIATHREP